MKFVDSVGMTALRLATYFDCNDLLSTWLELPEERRGAVDGMIGAKNIMKFANVNTKRNLEDFKVRARRASAAGSTTASSSTPTPSE
jgi:hypothetical protein